MLEKSISNTLNYSTFYLFYYPTTNTNLTSVWVGKKQKMRIWLSNMDLSTRQKRYTTWIKITAMHLNSLVGLALHSTYDGEAYQLSGFET